MRIFIFLLALLIFKADNSFSQQDTTNKKGYFIIKIDILYPILGGIDYIAFRPSYINAFSLTFEDCFKHKHSLQITTLFSDNNTVLKPMADAPLRVEYKVFQIIAEYKYFFKNEKDYAGFYCGAGVNYSNYVYINEFPNDVGPEEISTNKFEWKLVGAGLIFGYQNYILKRFTYDILMGLGHSYQIGKPYFDAYDGEMFLPSDRRLAINIGYKF